MKNSLRIIISREYLERVKRKSFIISTILVPLFMIGIMVTPTLLMMYSAPSKSNIAVIDNTGKIASSLQSSEEITFVTTTLSAEDAKASPDFDAVLIIEQDAISTPDKSVKLYSHDAPSMPTEQFISYQIEDAIENIRIQNYGIDNLAAIMNEVNVDLNLATFRLGEETESETSSLVSYILGTFTMLILYIFILLYGQMVMTSIIEEKNNRVLELVVSSVKPTQIMAGKIIGIGLVGLTQILIWAAIIIACAAWLFPSFSAFAAASGDTDLIAVIAQLSDSVFVINLVVYMILFIVGGYLFYSTIYAAIGSAVDNIQDASQLQSVAIVPIILALIVSMAVINDPNSPLAFWSSIIPFTSPMVMMARLPFGIPMWQPALSVVVLFLSSFFMVWLSAKIYRVGIFMYGKKPNISELIRWARYK